jgi:predicted DNA-binding ribbon-helix-helix protein
MPARKKSRPWNLALAAVAQCRQGIVARYRYIGKRRTSCRLDAATWEALCDVADRERVTISELCSEIAAARPASLSVTAAIRSWLIAYFRRRPSARASSVH